MGSYETHKDYSESVVDQRASEAALLRLGSVLAEIAGNVETADVSDSPSASNEPEEDLGSNQ